ncbi:MAG: hypothetical protein QHH30_07495 [candidate division NC10 bacterium]|nr:hypothetical protein [candidate division NC10 bacterium]
MRTQVDPRRVPEYDAILYGLSIESLTVGALLAKRGKRILILTSEEDREALPFFSQEGFVFEACPSLWLGADGERSHPALEELAISIDLRPLHPGLQVALPHHRFSLYPEKDLLGREVRREFPEGQEAIALFLERMRGVYQRMGGFLHRELASPPRGFWARWEQGRGIPLSLPAFFKQGKPSLLRHLKALGKDGETSSLIDTLVRGFGRVRSKDCSLLFASTLFTWLQQPIYLPEGGAKGVHDALLAAYERNGGAIRSVSRGLHLMRQGRRVGGLATEEGEEFVAHSILGGLGLWRICWASMMPKEAERWEGRLPMNRNLVLFLGVDEKVLPQEMGENLLLISDSPSSSSEGNPLWLLQSPAGDETRAPRGKRALSAILPLAPQDRRSDEEVEGMASELMEKLEEFLPFLSRGICLQGVHLHRSLSMLNPGRRWGFRFGVAPLKQMGYPGPRSFTPQRNLFLIGELPIYGIGLRARLDGGTYWANFLVPHKGGKERG